MAQPFAGFGRSSDLDKFLSERCRRVPGSYVSDQPPAKLMVHHKIRPANSRETDDTDQYVYFYSAPMSDLLAFPQHLAGWVYRPANGNPLAAPAVHYSFKWSRAPKTFLQIDVDGYIPSAHSCLDVVKVVVRAAGRLATRAGLGTCCSAWHSCCRQDERDGYRRVSLHLRWPLVQFQPGWQETRDYEKAVQFVEARATEDPAWRDEWTPHLSPTNAQRGLKFDLHPAQPASGSLRGPFSGKMTWTPSRNKKFVRTSLPIDAAHEPDNAKPFVSRPPCIYYAGVDRDNDDALVCRQANPEQLAAAFGAERVASMYAFLPVLVPWLGELGCLELPDDNVIQIGGPDEAATLSLEFRQFRDAEREERVADDVRAAPAVQRLQEMREFPERRRFGLYDVSPEESTLVAIQAEVQEAILLDETKQRTDEARAAEEAAAADQQFFEENGRQPKGREKKTVESLLGPPQWPATARVFAKHFAVVPKRIVRRVRDDEGGFAFALETMEDRVYASLCTCTIIPGRNRSGTLQPINALKAWTKGQLGRLLVPVPYDGITHLPFLRCSRGPFGEAPSDPTDPHYVNTFATYLCYLLEFPPDDKLWSVNWRDAREWPKPLLEFLHRVFFCICDQDPHLFHDFLDFLADIILNPHDSKGKSFIFTGPAGCGKNACLNAIVKWLIGAPCARTMQNVKRITGNFNSTLGTLHLIHFDEATTSNEDAQTLKNLVTESDCTINEKYLPERPQKQFVKVVFSVNDIKQLNLELGKDQRRYRINRVREWPRSAAPIKTHYFDQHFADCKMSTDLNPGNTETPEAMRQLAFFLREVCDVSSWHNQRRNEPPPLTTSGAQAIVLYLRQTRSIEHELFERLVSGGFVAPALAPVTNEHRFNTRWSIEEYNEYKKGKKPRDPTDIADWMEKLFGAKPDRDDEGKLYITTGTRDECIMYLLRNHPVYAYFIVGVFASRFSRRDSTEVTLQQFVDELCVESSHRMIEALNQKGIRGCPAGIDNVEWVARAEKPYSQSVQRRNHVVAEYAGLLMRAFPNITDDQREQIESDFEKEFHYQVDVPQEQVAFKLDLLEPGQPSYEAIRVHIQLDHQLRRKRPLARSAPGGPPAVRRRLLARSVSLPARPPATAPAGLQDMYRGICAELEKLREVVDQYESQLDTDDAPPPPPPSRPPVIDVQMIDAEDELLPPRLPPPPPIALSDEEMTDLYQAIDRIVPPQF